MQTPDPAVPSGFPCGKTFLLPGPAGALEVMTSCPDPHQAHAGTVVICHPHPQQGGTMHNKVVHTLARSFGELGLRMLRFNFRGVGASAGSFDRGEGETEDVLALLEWVRVQRPEDDIWLAGFSFGGYVAARAAHRFDVKQLVTVAPAVHLYDFAALQAPPAPWLVIQGDADEVVSADAVSDWVASRQPRPELVVLEGVGHFFHGRLHDLRRVVYERLGPRRPRAAPEV